MSTRSTWSRAVSGAAILAVAVVSGVISYGHIYDLSLSLHQSVLAARLMPVAIDGLIMVGSIVLLESGSRLGWLGVGPGLALSVFANLESGLRFGSLSAVWAATPSLSFFLATFIFERWLKAQTKVAATIPTAARSEVGDSDDVPDGVPSETAWAVPKEPVHDVPVRVPAPRTPRRTSGNTPPVLEKVFAAELAAGRVPSIRQLKTRLRVGSERATQIRDELAATLEDVPETA